MFGILSWVEQLLDLCRAKRVNWVAFDSVSFVLLQRQRERERKKAIKLVVISRFTHFQLFKRATFSKLTTSICSTTGLPATLCLPQKTALIYGTFGIALLHLIVLRLAQDVGNKEGGEGLNDALRKEHLIQSGDDIKKCFLCLVMFVQSQAVRLQSGASDWKRRREREREEEGK